MNEALSFQCPFPIEQYPIITMAHGAGGRLTQQLLDDIFRPAFSNAYLEAQHDGAILNLPSTRVAVTTDSFVVHPLFFPGGNIGELAIIGSLNDLAMCAAKPMYITCAFILTEGFAISTLIEIVDSMRRTAIANEIQIVAGDIKVVDKTNEVSLYINTTAIGAPCSAYIVAPQSIQDEDVILLSGDLGRHGIAVLAKRYGFEYTPPILTDCMPLWPLVHDLLKKDGLTLHCLRDLTRGGLASALLELAATTHYTFEIDEAKIPLTQGVHAVCEILGLDPLFVANEGRMLLILPSTQAEIALSILKTFPGAEEATCIGRVYKGKKEVLLKTRYGGKNRIMPFSGEQLPRIC